MDQRLDDVLHGREGNVLLPFLWMLASSFKSNAEISALEQHFLPLHPSVDNYLNAL